MIHIKTITSFILLPFFTLLLINICIVLYRAFIKVYKKKSFSAITLNAMILLNDLHTQKKETDLTSLFNIPTIYTSNSNFSFSYHSNI